MAVSRPQTVFVCSDFLIRRGTLATLYTQFSVPKLWSSAHEIKLLVHQAWECARGRSVGHSWRSVWEPQAGPGWCHMDRLVSVGLVEGKEELTLTWPEKTHRGRGSDLHTLGGAPGLPREGGHRFPRRE